MKLFSAFLASALAGSMSAYAAPPVSDGQNRRVIVQLEQGLDAASVDLADLRMFNKKYFGNLRSEVLGHIQRLEKKAGFKARHGFNHTLKGFSAELSPAQIALLRNDSAVRLIEPDLEIVAVEQTVPYGIKASGATTSTAARAGDGLDNAHGLAGVQVFVLDTGVAAHPDLNLVEQVNYVGDNIDGDCTGHGTHVAGTVGARDDGSFVVGVAPGVPLASLKVLGCGSSGFLSDLIKGFDYAASMAMTNPATKYIATASIALNPPGSVSEILDTSMTRAVDAGLVLSVAAGNSSDNTCTTSMVRLSSATQGKGILAVSAVDSYGQEPYFSSYGPCIAIWAPGVSVLSTSASGGLASMSGTSMATPHVAGAAAVIRAVNPSLTPAQVDLALKEKARSTGYSSKDGRLVRQLDISSVSFANPVPSLSIAHVTTPLLDFGVAKTSRPAVTAQALVSNVGNARMTLTGLSGLPGMLKIVASTCTNVEPGKSCAITLEMGTDIKRGMFSTVVSTVGASTNGLLGVKGRVK